MSLYFCQPFLSNRVGLTVDISRKPYMFTVLSKRSHAERKRMLANLYSQSHIQSSPELEDISKVIVSGRMRTKVDAWAREHATVDVLAMNKACLLDLTTAWLYGLGNGTDLMTDRAAADRVLGAFKLRSAGFFWRSEFSRMIKFIERFGLHLVPQAAYRSGQLIDEWNSTMCKTASKHLSLTQPSTNNNNDEINPSTSSYPLVYAQLRRRLEESDLSSGEEFEATLSRELLDHLVASHVASGIILTYLMHNLSQHRPLQRALRDELRRSRASHPTTFPHREALRNLPLLDAVLMETLRLHSSSPGPWPRRVPVTGSSSSCRLGDFANIPAGTVVSASSYSLHRNGDVFPFPEEWRPERWMDASVQQHGEMMRWFWAFGSGARMCLGRHFAVQSEWVGILFYSFILHCVVVYIYIWGRFFSFLFFFFFFF